jgi:hypothetical protein
MLATLLPAVDAHSCTSDQAPKAPVCGVLERLLPSADSCKAEGAPQATCDVLAPLRASCPIGSRVRKHSRVGLFAAIAKRLAKVNRHIRARARQACRTVATSLAKVMQEDVAACASALACFVIPGLFVLCNCRSLGQPDTQHW